MVASQWFKVVTYNMGDVNIFKDDIKVDPQQIYMIPDRHGKYRIIFEYLVACDKPS